MSKPRTSLQNGANKDKPPEAMYFFKPEEKTMCQTIGTFIYDSKKGAFFSRTPLSWAKIIFFYMIFYSCLAGLALSCMYVFMHFVIEKSVGPRWQLEESIIGNNPGLAFRPQNHHWHMGHTLIVVNTKLGTHHHYVQQLDEFLQPYSNLLGAQREVCDHERQPRNRSLTSCAVDTSQWEPCTSLHSYGYNQSAPCVFLKLNKIYNWEPEAYNSTDDLPEDMPKRLRDHITNISITEPEKLNTVWLTCEGELPDDKEHVGKVKYLPEQGFPGFYYPFLSAEGYLSPLVALQFIRPTPGVIIKIECRVWAKNLKYDRKDATAAVKFQLFVES